jgi:hypothetical protein
LSRFIQPVWSDRPGPDPLSGIETSLAFAGVAGYWFPRTGADGSELPRVCMQIRYSNGGFYLSVEQQPPRPAPSLVRWSRDLRRYARSTPRVMALDDALSFRKSLVLEPRPGVTFRPGGLLTDVRRLVVSRLPARVEGLRRVGVTSLGAVCLSLVVRPGSVLEDSVPFTG